jgi:enoyl-CoA hydratase
MDFKTLLLDIKEHTAVITLNRPEALNALNSELYVELNKALTIIEENETLRALIITGQGKAFVAGADISEMSGMNSEQGRKFAIVGQDTFNRLSSFRIPVIAAVNGFALGGGCEFAMGCDIRIANEFAKFGQPEVNLGLIPGYCGTQRLSRIVGLGNALHLLMTADMIDANEALRIGLVQKVVPAADLLTEAEKIANKIASKGKMSVQKVKEVTVKGLNMDFYDACDYEATEFGGLFDGEEAQEGMKAFLEKRKPNW